MIYGATGFTGRLISAAACSAGIDVILAGRNQHRLEALASSLGAPMRVMQIADTDNFVQALKDVQVVLNVAGPFAQTARPVLDACLLAGTHYLDVSGEFSSFLDTHSYDEAARYRGLMVMPGAGFVVVPSDRIGRAHV